ncbi:1099_t:CDS:2, partial [Racocetra persica]
NQAFGNWERWHSYREIAKLEASIVILGVRSFAKLLSHSWIDIHIDNHVALATVVKEGKLPWQKALLREFWSLLDELEIGTEGVFGIRRKVGSLYYRQNGGSPKHEAHKIQQPFLLSRNRGERKASATIIVPIWVSAKWWPIFLLYQTDYVEIPPLWIVFEIGLSGEKTYLEYCGVTGQRAIPSSEDSLLSCLIWLDLTDATL